MSVSADHLSRLDLGSLVGPEHDEGDLTYTAVSTEGLSGLEAHLVFIVTHLSGPSIDHLESETSRKSR